MSLASPSDRSLLLDAKSDAESEAATAVLGYKRPETVIPVYFMTIESHLPMASRNTTSAV
jgi:hypothetical protein